MRILVSRFRPRFSPHILYYLDQHGKVLGYRLSVRFFKEKYAKWCNGKLRSAWDIFSDFYGLDKYRYSLRPKYVKNVRWPFFHWNKKEAIIFCPQLTQEECPLKIYRNLYFCLMTRVDRLCCDPSCSVDGFYTGILTIFLTNSNSAPHALTSWGPFEVFRAQTLQVRGCKWCNVYLTRIYKKIVVWILENLIFESKW